MSKGWNIWPFVALTKCVPSQTKTSLGQLGCEDRVIPMQTLRGFGSWTTVAGMLGHLLFLAECSHAALCLFFGAGPSQHEETNRNST